MDGAEREYARELAVAEAAARAAGRAILDAYQYATAGTYTKDDGSFVTDADYAADRIIRASLADAFPDDAILTEEGVDDEARLSISRCWVVDPLDGTKQFVTRTGEFDVLIALCLNGRPVVGVLYQPTTDLLLSASIGAGAWREEGGCRAPLRLSPLPLDAPPRLMSSVWLGAPENGPLLERTTDRLGGGTVTISPLGITVRRFIPPDASADALIGVNAEVDLRMAHEWDFAAPEVVVSEAGGAVSDVWGRPHRYNKRSPRNVGGILLSVDPATHARILAALRPELPPPPAWSK